jgi:hypothetical protein
MFRDKSGFGDHGVKSEKSPCADEKHCQNRQVVPQQVLAEVNGNAKGCIDRVFLWNREQKRYSPDE